MERVLLFFIQGIPESSGHFALSLALLGVPLRWKPIVAAGTVLALIFFAVRALPFTFGFHAAVGIFFLVIAINRATRMPLINIFIAVVTSFATLFLLELVIMEIFFAATKLDPNTAMAENNLLWMLSGLPQAFLLILFALLISKFRKPREDAWKI